MDRELVMVLFRGTILVIVALSGAMSIFLGWKLYKDGMLSDVSGEASGVAGLRVKLVSAGPGIFFAAFGMALLAFLAARQLDLSEVEEVAPPDPSPVAAVATPSPTSEPNGCSVSDSSPPMLIRAQSRAAKQPTTRCIVRRSRVLFLDGDELNAARIRQDAGTARRILLAADRSGLPAKQRTELDDAAETMQVIQAGATDE